MTRIPQHDLNLAGEYRVCSELIKRGIFATITYGNRKSADVYAFTDEGRVVRIEVKTSQKRSFVTSITQKGLADSSDAPHIWVLFYLKPLAKGDFEERFFILTHDEICAAQSQRNCTYAAGYRARHGREPGFSTGVDNVNLADIETFEDAWDSVEAAVRA